MKDAAVNFKKIILILSVIVVMSCMPLFAEVSSVTINSANRTDYIKDAETGDELISFSGDVNLSVDKNDQKIEIQAESVIYNRTRGTLYAEGNIVFTRAPSGGTSEKLTARTLLFNIETLEGVFDQGRVTQEQSDNINLPSGSSLYVSSDLFGRDNSGTVAFKDGTLTFCDDPEPHWQIKASRIWLLPGNEFSFFNAVLYVGHLPVMYFPFFYYPKDEMIFNPVFSYDARRGYSLQTTTYIIGRKAVAQDNDDDGLFSFMRTTELKKQERDGLFLRNLDENDTMGTDSLKLMADIYSNLGVMAGIEGVFKPSSAISSISFKSYFGFSNTIFPAGTQYTTYSPSLAMRYVDSSYILGLHIPFRYYGDFSMKIAKSPFSLSLSLPLYSDIYFESDFLTRSESMDWINYLLQNPVLVSGDSSSSGTVKTSFSWILEGSVSTPDFIKKLSPYVSTFSISSIKSSVNFNYKNNEMLTGENAGYSPERTFFYPSSLYPLKMSLSVSGTLLSSGSAVSDSSASGNTDSLVELTAPPDMSGESALSDADENAYEAIPSDLMPVLSFQGLSKKELSGLQYSLTYSLSPALATEMYFDTGIWHSPEDIDWQNVKSSYFSLKIPLTLKDTFSWKNNFLSLNNSFQFHPEYQNHPVVSESAYPAGSSELENLRVTDYQARKLDLTAVSSLSFKPFVLSDTFADTSLTWNNTVKLIRTKFTGTADNPAWTYLGAEWEPEAVTAHDMTLVLGAKEGSYSQKFTLKANLPPQTESYTGTLDFGFRYCTSLSASTTLKRRSRTDDTWIFTPLSQSSKWSFLDKNLSFIQNYSFNIEDSHSESLTLSLAGYGLKAAFNMGWTKPYELISGQGWVMQQQSDFVPKTASVSYVMPKKTFYSWYNRISFAPSLSTSLNIDLLRPTDSSFVFTPSFTYRINQALDITFSAESRNQVLFRYIQDFYDYDARMPGETNMFVDLFNSFAFWDTELRKSSGFKLKNISIKLSHELHDWVLNSEFKIEPRLLRNPNRYDFSPYFTLSVVWRPMSSMKTTIQDKYGTFVLNPE